MVKNRWRSSVLDTRSFWRSTKIAKSDHALVVSTIRIRFRVNAVKKSMVRPDTRLLDSEDVATKFRDKVSANIHDNYFYDTVDEMWKALKSGLLDAAKTTLRPTRRKHKPWISSTTLELVHQRSTSLQKRSPGLDMAINHQLKVDMEQFWEQKASDIENAGRVGDVRKIYNLLRETAQPKKAVSDRITDVNGMALCGEDAKLSAFVEHFSNLLNCAEPTNTHEELIDQPNHQHGAYNCSTDPPSVEEVRAAISKLKSNKAAGEDNIQPELIKKGGDTVVMALYRLFQKIWNDETTPSSWSTATICSYF